MARTPEEKAAAVEAVEELQGSVQQMLQLLAQPEPRLGKLKAFAAMAKIEAQEAAKAIQTYATNPRGPREPKKS